MTILRRCRHPHQSGGKPVERHEGVLVIVAKFLSESLDTNPYASAATMRALDQAVRNTLSGDLTQLASRWRALYQDTSAKIPLPSREHPFPDRGLLDQAKALKAVADQLSQLASQATALEAPSNDRVYNRIRKNDVLLETLIEIDRNLALTARQMEEQRESLDADNLKEIRTNMHQLEALMGERRRLLAPIP